ncbi:unnamed protein product [Kluyveromyces dobzhanskii CBS 2104]|uniref:DNA polymerase gamma n=1 Tax=Kluyveromyces dobzhanskii CBS 2104 TaxID=1427455 RepID=A0A0A8L8G2_9SACH|nr:unnamed protein product [Kluyveromyces dobzhanskii CBS 2104]
MLVTRMNHTNNLLQKGAKSVRKVRYFHRTVRVKTNESEVPRINPVGIQYLSNSLYEQLFPSKDKYNKFFNDDEKQELIKLSKQFLKNHDLLGKPTNISDPISFELPKLQGRVLDEHFQKLGHFASEPYRSMCDKKFKKILPKPQKWLREPGWYRYEPGKDATKVPYPLEDTLVFDVEVLYKISDFPTLAVALSDKAWYLWCSPFICDDAGSDDFKHLIPMNTLEKPKLIIGHNVGYDRSKVLEEYNFTPSKAYFIDTMSLHVATSGMCSRQRPTYMKKLKRDEEVAQLNAENDSLPPISDVDEDSPWLTKSSSNSLKDVARFHCNIKMSKEARDSFSTLDKFEIINNFDAMVDYCAFDVEATSKVFDEVLPKFLKKCPHPVSFGALRFLSTAILPTRVNKWENYLKSSETLFQDNKQQIEKKIVAIIEDTLRLRTQSELVKSDPWLKQLDWNVTPIKYTKSGELHKSQKLPGYPEWYRSLFPTKTTATPQITIRTRQVPLFFRLTWEDCPVVYTNSQGWCFRCKNSQIEELVAKNYVKAVEVKDYHEEGTTLFKVPHPNGPEFNATTLLSKPFIHFFEKGILKSESKLALDALQINASGAYWMSARERIMSQHVVCAKDFKSEFNAKTSFDKDPDVGIILPKLVPMGTVTRRSVENTWLTASNAKKNRIGSELKCNVEAPPGYTFVGADVDSEELWIASLVGDSTFDIHGATAIGWMCLEGTKSLGTDLHSKTAQILGCSRNEAKVFNYGRIYGAGVKFATQLLKQFNPVLSEEEARKTATKLYENTKGKKQRSSIFKTFWYGGSESILFNKLESIAEQDEPKTPVLGAGITYSLMKKNLGKDSFLPSRINWVIQSSGVDYLHILCCSMNYLIEKYSIDARLVISIHDEIRYLVSEKDKYRIALALQISNLWTRSYFSEQMCINDLPQNCAFFSAVDVDKIMRKEVDMDCITPSNPSPIPHGQSLDILEILKITEGSLGMPSDSVDVSEFPYQHREPVFKQYNKRYSKDFLKYSIAMQIQKTKWKVEEVEKTYLREIEEAKFKLIDNDVMTMADYLKESKAAGKQKKRSIMSDDIMYMHGPASTDGNNVGIKNIETDIASKTREKCETNFKKFASKKRLTSNQTVGNDMIADIITQVVSDSNIGNDKVLASSSKSKTRKLKRKTAATKKTTGLISNSSKAAQIKPDSQGPDMKHKESNDSTI